MEETMYWVLSTTTFVIYDVLVLCVLQVKCSLGINA